MTAKTMSFREVGGVLLCVHPAGPPSERDWDAYVEFCKKLPKSCARTMVVTRGGGPDAKQRKKLNDEYLKDVKMKVAVVTDAAMVRGIVTALSWFNDQIRSFTYAGGQGVQEAMKYLTVEGGDADRIAAEIKKMLLEVATAPAH
jgi:hypothetical protein